MTLCYIRKWGVIYQKNVLYYKDTKRNRKILKEEDIEEIRKGMVKDVNQCNTEDWQKVIKQTDSSHCRKKTNIFSKKIRLVNI